MMYAFIFLSYYPSKLSGRVAYSIISTIKSYHFLIIMTVYQGIPECPYDVWKKEKRTNASTSKKKTKKLEDN